MREAALDELLRIIREEEPPRPSTKLSSSQTLPNIAANRRTEPARLSTIVRGELDWIVMKALEKDRNRRYETANGFAMDIQRYLAGEVVEACPPSVSYQIQKFTRREAVTSAEQAQLSAARAEQAAARERLVADSEHSAHQVGRLQDAVQLAEVVIGSERIYRSRTTST